ncbi:MAG TPA: cytochrome c [Bryobacteraceae bacterium]|nr:cytochrome c [Bryobacteraceae bacterium]
MILLALFLMQVDSGDIPRGAKIFAQSCAVGYCHGTAGAANRGPRLASRGFDRAFVDKVVKEGVPGTAMPPFKAMNPADLSAVIAYVMSISAGGLAEAAAVTPSHIPSPEPPRFPGPLEAKLGKNAFFDAARGVRCGTCHLVEEWGAAVGPNLAASPPQSVAAIRSVKAASVKTAVTSSGERFPALQVDRNASRVLLYDLTAAPPVLRTYSPGDVTLESNSNWSHSQAIQSYKDADLLNIVSYLRWLGSK